MTGQAAGFLEICGQARKEGKRLFILTHNFPDADALSSAFAIQYLLKTAEIPAEIVYGGRIDRSGTEKMVDIFGIRASGHKGCFSEEDAVIFTDCQAGNGNTTFSGGIALACMDHHPTMPGNFSRYRFMNRAETGACATLALEMLLERMEEIPRDVAGALLYGLEMDTLNFTRGVTKRDIDAFGFLYDKVDAAKLQHVQTSQLIASDLKAYGSAITNMRIVSDIGISYVPFDCPDGLIGALADFMLGLDEVSVSIIFSRRTNGIKLSVRTILPYIDAGKFVNEALQGIGSGGGHAMFAGGFIPNESIVKFSEDELHGWLERSFLKEYGKQLMASASFD